MESALLQSQEDQILDLQQKYEVNIEFLKGIKNLDKDWTLVSEKETLKSHFRKEGDLYLCRAEGTFPISLPNFIDLLNNPEKAKNINPDEIDRKQLLQIDQNTEVLYLKTKVPLISDRYAIIAAGTKKISESEVLCSCVSVDFNKIDQDKDICNKGLVCMDLKQGWFLKEVQGGKTQAVMVSCADPRGSIPGFMKKKIIKNRGMEQLMIVQEYCGQNS